MHLTVHDDVESVFKSSRNLYEFSNLNKSKRITTCPNFDLPIDVSATEDPKELARFRCNCRYLWLRELHGVSTLMMSNSLEQKLFWTLIILVCGLASFFNANIILGGYSAVRTTTKITFVPVRSIKYPNLVFCPKNADALNYTGLYNDLFANVGLLDNLTRSDIIRYVIAGSGFDNFNVSPWNNSYKSELHNLYNKWRANRTVLEMFDFVFNENGYRCEDFFQSCWAGSRVLECCSAFQPTYVMLRGRCFRLIDNYTQTDVDESEKLSLRFNNVQGSLSEKKNRSQVVMYVGDSHREVGLYPRFYLNYRDWNRVRFIQRQISMLPDNPMCSQKSLDEGKSTCFVQSWIQRVIVSRLNCTLPYFKGMLPLVDDVTPCDPSVIVNNYKNITSTTFENFGCLPACERIENQMQMTTSKDYSHNMNYSYQVESSFSDLEYEHYSEIRLTTTAGFISELGGQSGLFVGCSIMTAVQLVLSIVLFFVAFSSKIYKKLCLTFSLGREINDPTSH